MADSCPYLPFTKWYCSSGRHSVKALNYGNSGKRELLQRRWNSYSMISSWMFVFDASSPNNHLLIPFHSPLVSSAPPWSIALFSDNVIPLDLVPVNRPLSVSKVTKLIQRRMPCKQLYPWKDAMQTIVFCNRTNLLFDVNTRLRLWSIFWKSLAYFGKHV